MDEDEVLLTGGNAAGRVVRVGNTVRKPWLPTTPHTLDYMAGLAAAGIDVPEALGRDERGRLSVEFVVGDLAIDSAPLSIDLVHRVGALVRQIHDASALVPVDADWEVLIPVIGPDLVCHNDLATWNLIINGDRLVFIDWDGAGPSTRLWDLAYSAISFAHLFPDGAPQESAARLSAFLAGYGADSALREALPATMVERSRAMYDLLRRAHADGWEPWSSMYADGHGEHWLATTHHIESELSRWQTAVRLPEVTI